MAGTEPVARMQWSKVSRSAVVGRVIAPFELERLGVDENPPGVDHFYLAALGQLGQSAGEGVDHLLFASPHRVDFEFHLAEGDAPLGHLARLADDLGHVQQGLRGNAAAQQAGAAKPRVGFDDRHLEPQVGSHECRRIPAGASTQHDYLRLHRETLSRQKTTTESPILPHHCVLTMGIAGGLLVEQMP